MTDENQRDSEEEEEEDDDDDDDGDGKSGSSGGRNGSSLTTFFNSLISGWSLSFFMSTRIKCTSEITSATDDFAPY